MTKHVFRLAVAHHCTRSGGKEEVMLINALTNEQKNLICPPSHQNMVFNPDSQQHKNSLGKILLHDGKVKTLSFTSHLSLVFLLLYSYEFHKTLISF
jgi:hypothetical protein